VDKEMYVYGEIIKVKIATDNSSCDKNLLPIIVKLVQITTFTGRLDTWKSKKTITSTRDVHWIESQSVAAHSEKEQTVNISIN
jgi:hypothetical protein